MTDNSGVLSDMDCELPDERLDAVSGGAIPIGKTSKARKHSRRANWKLELPSIVECPRCHELRLAHRVCKNCGYCDGIRVEEPENKLE